MGPDASMCPDMPMGPGPEIPSRPPMGGDTGEMPSVPGGPGPVFPPENIDSFPVAMAYVPWQRWQPVYPVEQAIGRGTIFPDLDKPFAMGRCR